MELQLILELAAFAGIMRVAWQIRADVSTTVADMTHMKGRIKDHESRLRSIEADRP